MALKGAVIGAFIKKIVINMGLGIDGNDAKILMTCLLKH